MTKSYLSSVRLRKLLKFMTSVIVKYLCKINCIFCSKICLNFFHPLSHNGYWTDRVFAYPGSRKGTKAAFPKARLVILVELGTHISTWAKLIV